MTAILLTNDFDTHTGREIENKRSYRSTKSAMFALFSFLSSHTFLLSAPGRLFTDYYPLFTSWWFCICSIPAKSTLDVGTKIHIIRGKPHLVCNWQKLNLMYFFGMFLFLPKKLSNSPGEKIRRKIREFAQDFDFLLLLVNLSLHQSGNKNRVSSVFAFLRSLRYKMWM